MPNNEFGDFQTPRALAGRIVRMLGGGWSRVLEPTCGAGAFLFEATEALPGAEIVGVEVQAEHAGAAREAGGRVVHADVFGLHLGKDIEWRAAGPLLVVGNPPWVTNAELGRIGSGNRPDRHNVKKLNGLDAMTGASNFDIAEYIWLKLITELQHHRPKISLLCKTQVARSVLEHCARFSLPVSGARLHRIDAKKWFGALVDACLFTVEVDTGPSRYVCDLYDSLDAPVPSGRFGVVDGRLVADIDAYERARWLDGAGPVEWRQGIKHDAAAVMELVELDGPHTRTGTPVDIEEGHLYPLLKSTDVFRGRTDPRRWLVVPQRSLRDGTDRLALDAPRLWAYLNEHGSALDARKSSIYRNRPRFSVFGVGPYSFAPYKIAVSGLHKSAEFRLIGPSRGRPVVLDDTCYLLPFADGPEAALVTALLRTEPVTDLFRALAFWDAKRPITKKLLQRIDLPALATLTGSATLVPAARSLLAGAAHPASEQELTAGYESLLTRWSR